MALTSSAIFSWRASVDQAYQALAGIINTTSSAASFMARVWIDSQSRKRAVKAFSRSKREDSAASSAGAALEEHSLGFVIALCVKNAACSCRLLPPSCAVGDPP